MNLAKLKLPASAKKLLVLALGFGVGLVVAMAPLTGAQRIRYFQPLADILLERHKNLLLPVSGILLSVIALTVHFFYGERLSLKRLRGSFFITLAVFLVSVGALIKLPGHVIKPDCASEPIVVGWSRLPGCTFCPEGVSDAACLVRNECEISGCWSQAQVNAVELMMNASYLGALCGFVAVAGIVVLIERARAQGKRRPRKKKPVTPAPPGSGPPAALPPPRAQSPAT